MTDYNVTPANFSSVFGSAVGGDRLILADGNYGSLTLFSKNFSPRITIEAENRYGAVFSSVASSGSCSGFNFIGVDLGNNPDWHNPGSCSEFTFTYCKSNGYFRAPYFVNLTLLYHYHVGTMACSSNTGLRYDQCVLHNVDAIDAMRIEGSADFEITNSIWFDIFFDEGAVDPHSDFLQAFLFDGVQPNNGLIRGNIFIDDTSTPVVRLPNLEDPPQGIFFGGPSGGYTNITIEQNMLRQGSPNGIRLTNSGTNCVIRNNSLITSSIITNNESGQGPGASVTDNIASLVLDQSTGGSAATTSGNVSYNNAADIYKDPTGLDWTQFEPKAAFDTKGAATRYAEILAGTNVEAINVAILNGVSFTSPGTATPAIPVITGVPTISGTATEGQTLTVTAASVAGSPVPIRTWSWERDGTPIADATAGTYVLTASDVGAVITVVQTETNASGVDTAESAATSAVSAVAGGVPTLPASITISMTSA